PGVSSSRWLTAFNPRMVEDSGLGMALLARMENDAVKKLFEIHPLTRFRSLDALLVELERIRDRGYSFTPTIEGHHTIGVVLESNPNIGLGVAGDITEKDVPRFLEPL